MGNEKRAKKAARNVPPQKQDRHGLVISVHGIRTRGTWQKELAGSLSAQGFVVEAVDYGFFRAFRLLLPSQRRKQVEWFRDQYELICSRHQGLLDDNSRPSVVAHSFGTYLVAVALAKYEELCFDRIILCGSIVPADYEWPTLPSHRFTRLLNDYGRQDLWAKLAQWFIADAGDSGSGGFERDEDRVVQREHATFCHSDYFYRLNYEKRWIPFLRGTDPPSKPELVHRRNWKFAVTCTVFILLCVLVLTSLLILWRLPGIRHRTDYSRLQQLEIGMSQRKAEELFGIPSTERNMVADFHVTTHETEYYRIVAVYKERELAAFSITTRDTGFTPPISLGDGHQRLGEALFTDFHVDSPDYWYGEWLPKDYLYYETSYLGNSLNYATCLLAFSHTQGAHTQADYDALDWLGEVPIIMQHDIDVTLTEDERAEFGHRFRECSVPNTVGVSILHRMGELPDDLGFDLNRILIYEGAEIRGGGLRQ